VGNYSSALPQLEESSIYLTDGGLETVLIFRDGIDLPEFAACDLLRTREGTASLRKYFDEMAGVATAKGIGFLIDTATWRANPDWTSKLGYSTDKFESINRKAVELALAVRAAWEQTGVPMPISGVVGPRGDGYRPDRLQSVDEARDYHSAQISVFAETGAVDFVTAVTMNYPNEATGVALAAHNAGLPVVISFTVETNGRLATGESLEQAISFVDDATDSYPAYYMVNCAHPTHLAEDLSSGEPWTRRVRGYRANASSQSHAELDEAEELDDGNPEELGGQFRVLRDQLPNLNVLGGCCGTDKRHLEAIAAAVA